MVRVGGAVMVPDVADGTESQETTGTGYGFELDGLLAVTPTLGIGLHTSIAHFRGHLEVEEVPLRNTLEPLTDVPVIIAATAEQRLFKIVYVAPFVGVSYNRFHDNLDTLWDFAFAYGGSIGVDALHVGANRLAVFGSIVKWTNGDRDYTLYSIGLAYHR
jgi:hypothetical protein